MIHSLARVSPVDFSKPWTEYEYVAFDTETSGAYPFGADVVEFGAVKWRGGQVVDTYQTLLRPKELMSAFIIGIHGITNEMVEDAPVMKEKIREIRDFLGEGILMAHHAPFDMGFMALEFQRYQIPLPANPVLCTSLLARKIITESENHKLQTLISVLGLERGSAHRAKDDAHACLHVGLECFRRKGEAANLREIFSTQGKDLAWTKYEIFNSGNVTINKVIECLEEKLSLDIVYQGGSGEGSGTRRITPIGIVRNPDGDYVMAKCHRDAANKRFYIQKIKDAAVVYP
jgi:DNA polymerase-3 subunit epsilon